MFNPGLHYGEIIDNRQLMNIFHCACEGGIRYSSKTGAIVIVVNNTKKGLPNIWNGEILEFAGRPLKASGELSGSNRRLDQFLSNGEDVFLFVVNKPGKYEFHGRVHLAAQIKIMESNDLQYPVFPLKIESMNKKID